MKISALCLAIALSMPALVSANAATKEIEGGKFGGNWQAQGDWSISGSVGNGNLDGRAAKLGSGGILGVITQSFTLDSAGAFKLGFDYKAVTDLTVLITSTSGFSWAKDFLSSAETSFSKKFSLNGGDYTISFLSKNAVVDNVKGNFTAAVAVPGPEAGAGLGALALGGVALYMKRRRREERVAA